MTLPTPKTSQQITEQISQLMASLTRNDWRDRLLVDLEAQKIKVTDWHSGGVQLTNVYMLAQALTDLDTRAIPQLVASGFVDTAAGEWLDLVALSQYDEARKPSEFAVLEVALSATVQTGQINLRPGDIRVKTAAGLRYQSIDAATVVPGTPVVISLRAQSPGAEYNISAGTALELLTPYPGLTLSYDGTLRAAGVDAETDDALRTRLKLKWSTIGHGANADAYRFWALSASPAVTQVRILDQHPRGQGTVDVVLWGAGALSAEDVAEVNTYIQKRRSVTADVQVYAATPRNISMTGTVYVYAAQLFTAQATAEKTLQQLQNDSAVGGTVYRSAIIEAIMMPAGVRNVDLTSPATDVPLSQTEAAVFDFSGLLWVGI